MTDASRVIVIGSGPAGAMAAQALVRKNIPVVMLESGSAPPGGWLVRLMGKNVFRRCCPIESGNRHVATGAPDTQWYTNLAPGGLSNQWTGAVPRFAPEDFTEGERLHPRYRWPLGYDELVPFYQEAESLLRITATPEGVPSLPAGLPAYSRQIPRNWRPVARCAAAHGQGLTVLPLADGPPFMIAHRGTAFNSFSNIVQPLLSSSLFALITDAHVLRLEWSPTRKQVAAVVYQERSTGAQHRLAAAAVVVACGALNSTKLLFDSACADFPQGLGNTEGLLGRFLHDHPREWWVLDLEKPISRLSPPAYLTRVPYAASAPLQAASWTLGLASMPDKILALAPTQGRSIGVQVFGTMVPTEHYHVKPDPARKDEFGLPILDICIRYDAEVVANMRSARERLVSLMEESGHRATIRDAVLQLTPGSSVHYGGTTRMHSSPRYGVVDAWNRLHDAPNVIVSDASCFTTGPEKNPTLTAMALSARAAGRLADDLRTR